jgi:hypothetical protein
VIGVIRLYGYAATRAARQGARAWPVMFSLVLYAAIFMVTSQLTGRLGPLRGIVLGLVLAACFSSYIHLISHVVSGSKLHFAELRRSFLARFWDVISVLFAFWIIQLILTHVMAPAAGTKAPIVVALSGLAMAVFFNPVPELLYQGSSRSFHLLLESGRFVSRYGLEWLVPNILFALALLAPLGLLQGPAGLVILHVSTVMSPDNNGMGLYDLFARAPLYLQLPMLLFVHFVMVFRGVLFGELTRGGGARQRALRGAWRR